MRTSAPDLPEHSRPHTIDGPFDDGGMKIRSQNLLTFLAALPDRLGVSVVEIDQHHHAGLRCNAGPANESNGLFVVPRRITVPVWANPTCDCAAGRLTSSQLLAVKASDCAAT